MKRNKYNALSRLPPYGLYKEDKLVASVRAHSAKEAKLIFKAHKDVMNLEGDTVRRIKEN